MNFGLLAALMSPGDERIEVTAKASLTGSISQDCVDAYTHINNATMKKAHLVSVLWTMANRQQHKVHSRHLRLAATRLIVKGCDLPIESPVVFQHAQRSLGREGSLAIHSLVYQSSGERRSNIYILMFKILIQYHNQDVLENIAW